jgi:hypothetical protein
MDSVEACCHYAAIIALNELYAQILRDELLTGEDVCSAILTKMHEMQTEFEGE